MITILSSTSNIIGEGEGGGSYMTISMSMRIYGLTLDIRLENYEENGYGLLFDMLIVSY